MAISTASTILKYATSCPLQVETATVVGTISTAGNCTVVFTSKELASSPITLQVAVALSDTATAVATKIRTALTGNAEISNLFTINGSNGSIVITKKVPTENDSTLNVSIANGTCAGLTNAPTSADTTAGGTFTKLVDIVSYPDLGATPSKLDTTTLTDTIFKTSIMGLQEVPDLTFEANYDETVYNTINNMTASNYFFQLEFGTDGKFNWQGQVRIYTNGGGVDEVRKMTVALSSATALTFTAN